MSRYQSISHAKFRIHYHLVFSTKFKAGALVEIEDELREMVLAIGNSKYSVVECGVDKNHMHVIVKAKPTITVGQIVADVKKKSTLWAWENHRGVMGRYFWKKRRAGRRVLWTYGYFCESVGNVSYEGVLDYVRNQG